MEFTGERLVPGKVEPDLWAEHFSRYVFAEPYVAERHVLDLGTGAGYGAQRLARTARSVTALDVAHDAVVHAAGHHPAPALRHVTGDALALPFRSGAFEVVVAFEVIEHVPDPAVLLAEVRRVLTPSGVFLVSTPNKTYYTEERNEHNAFHVREFELDEFVRFLKSAFPSVELRVQNHAPAVVIGPPVGDAAGPTDARLVQDQAPEPAEAVRTAHYGIAVCGLQPLPAPAVVFLPEGSGNVLRTREQHIRLLDQQLSSIRREWDERGAWGQRLDSELQETRHRYEELARQFEDRSAWAEELDRELASTRSLLQRLATESEHQRSASQRLQADLATALQHATRLDGELRDTNAEATNLREAVTTLREEAARLGRELDAARLAQQQALEALEPERRSSWPLRALDAFARRVVARRVLPYTAAAAAVPLAASVGAAAVALEAVARRLPPHRPLPVRLPPRTDVATILVLNYDGRDLLARNIPFLRAAVARSGRPHRILVVDNGSRDGSADFVRATFPDVEVVAFPRNHFFSGGNDRGLRHVETDVVVLLNNDMRVEPDFLDPLLRPFAADPAVFAVASHILMAGRQEETGLTRGRFVRGMIEFRHDPVPADLPARAIPILWGGGGACAFDRRKFLQLGGLDVLYDPFYCEDSDLSLRAWMRGWKVLFTPESRVWHEHRTTSRRVFGESFVNETVRRNNLLLHWANLRDPGLLAEHLAALPRVAYEAVRQDPVSGARALARAALRAPRALARRLREREPGPSLREVLERTDVGLDPTERIPPRGRRATDPLRVTMVVPYHMYPVTHGGAVRMYNVARELARRGHDVSVVGFVDSEEEREASRHLEEFCGEVRLLVRRGPGDGAARLVPGDVREFDRRALRQELADHIARRSPDVLQIEYTQLAPYGRLAGGRLACLTEHDIAFVSRYRHALALQGAAERARAYVQYLKTFRYELEALRGYDVVFAVTSRDAEMLRCYLDGAVHVSDRAPTGVDVEAMGRVERRPDPATLVFVGNFAHQPNVDAVSYFASAVLPELHRRRPEVRVVIAGARPPESLRRLAADPRVEVPGFVADLGQVYARATAFVAPIRVAAGVRVKLLEAFAARVPVISTRAGAEGIDVVHDRDILLADDPAGLVDQTIRLLDDPSVAERIVPNARRLVEQRYSWPSIVEALEDEYRAGIRRKQLRGGA